MTHGLDPIRTAVVHPVDVPSLLGGRADHAFSGDFSTFGTALTPFVPATLPGFSINSRNGLMVAHGMWSGALICTVLGTQLPGPGTVYVDQSLHFQGAIGLKIGAPSGCSLVICKIRVLRLAVMAKLQCQKYTQAGGYNFSIRAAGLLGTSLIH